MTRLEKLLTEPKSPKRVRKVRVMMRAVDLIDIDVELVWTRFSEKFYKSSWVTPSPGVVKQCEEWLLEEL